MHASSRDPARVIWPFLPFAVLSVVHVVILAVAPAGPLAMPTKLLLMPALALAALWAGRRTRPVGPLVLLIAAIALSWIGDGAAVFVPFAPELPVMLLFFGLAHLAYIALFWRNAAVRRLPWWALVYVVWWVGILVILLPHLGALTIAVAAYGVVLGLTAAFALRCLPLVAVGGAAFLASDTILAFRLFLPDAIPDWTSPAVMVTYTLGQGLIAAGVIVTLRRRASRRVGSAS